MAKERWDQKGGGRVRLEDAATAVCTDGPLSWHRRRAGW